MKGDREEFWRPPGSYVFPELAEALERIIEDLRETRDAWKAKKQCRDRRWKKGMLRDLNRQIRDLFEMKKVLPPPESPPENIGDKYYQNPNNIEDYHYKNIKEAEAAKETRGIKNRRDREKWGAWSRIRKRRR